MELLLHEYELPLKHPFTISRSTTTAQRTLIVSDLHLEKGSSYAQRGQLLPPYDTGATLKLVEPLIGRFAPERVISLGDSFHDPAAEARLSPGDRLRIRTLTASTDWIWVEGNHDPDPPAHLGGRGEKVLRIGDCVFRHEPTGEEGELAGHLHPVAKVTGRGRSVRRKCFVTDGERMILPSLGRFTGGLNVLDPAISRIFVAGHMVFGTSSAASAPSSWQRRRISGASTSIVWRTERLVGSP